MKIKHNSLVFVKTYSAINWGLQVKVIEVELDTTIGKPEFVLIGLANRAVGESKERISAALHHCGVRIKPLRTIVNLAPAELQKTSSALELAIAVALLEQYQVLPAQLTKKFFNKALFLGELSLTGQLKAVKGLLPIALRAKHLGFTKLYFPETNLAELGLIKDLQLFPLASLQELIKLCKQDQLLTLSHKLPKHSAKSALVNPQHYPDLAEFSHQQQATRALTLSAAGGHHLLLFGEPGAGKTYLAQSILSILPALSEAEQLELNQIYSLLSPLSDGLIQQRPFRDPHHSISKAAFLGSLKAPGELSLAHLGVLFLDEITELRRDLLEALRQPLTSQIFKLNRLKQQIIYPANFTLIAAANPCPCGFYGSNKPCRCSTYDLLRYQKKLSGPVIDRLDLSLRLTSEQRPELFSSPQAQVKTKTIAQQVAIARKTQRQRYQTTSFQCNANLTGSAVKHFCHLSVGAQRAIALAVSQLDLSVRAYFKIIKVAQTITDLKQKRVIEQAAIYEALSFRQSMFKSSK